MKAITIELSADSCSKALKELEKYQKEIKPKLDEVCKRLAEIGVAEAQAHLVLADGNTDATILQPVKIENGYKIVMQGKDVYFIEFGTGDGVSAHYDTSVPVAWGSWSAEHSQMLFEHGFWYYDKVRYSLCRVAFDAEKGEISSDVDTIVKADSLSYTFPRISPNGKYLMYTETAYGQFPIWHKDAEIRMVDLDSRQTIDMSQINSHDTESYHSWSSGSDWVVVSSRRDNSLYTLPYLCFIGEDGKPGKPFLLPQEDPETYDYLLYSYNIPELVTGEVEVSPYEIQQVALNEEAEQVKFE